MCAALKTQLKWRIQKNDRNRSFSTNTKTKEKFFPLEKDNGGFCVMKSTYREHDCAMKNESACEEEVEEDGSDYEEIEAKEFGED